VITQHTALCGIVLHPAGHTLSPAMHNAAYAALGVDAVYLAFDVEPRRLAAAIAGWRALRGRLLSVSIPHKQAILEQLDRVDETARRIGAVNTVVLAEDGSLIGSNTDWLGAVRALERETPLAGRQAVVLGAGGTARAVAWGLCERGARVRVLNRSEGRARELADALGCDAGPLSALRGAKYDVLVNATSVGLREDVSPVEAEWIAPGAVVLDAVYDPIRTRLLRDAERRGAKPVSGKWMLVHQAAAQIEAWTRRTPPLDQLAAAFDAGAGLLAR